ncbi:AAA family ATPase [uncultured Salinibacterium sp.]|uniref:AAA family ATPase n=1 Tax=uncultured Salinibacterium sp. TaxID=459274 RepID=UPI0030DA80CB
MRLVKAEVYGFGRLTEAKVNLDNKVIAVVGPNEAGKTTLLKALAYIDNGKSLSVTERSRSTTPINDSDVVVSTYYLLDDVDRAEVEEFDLQEPPKALRLSRSAAGASVVKTVTPRPRKAVAPLVTSLKALKKTLTKANLNALASLASEEGDASEPEERRISFATRVAEAIRSVDVDLSVDETPSVAEALDPATWIAEFEEFGLAGPLREALESVQQWLDRADPAHDVEERLYEIAPDILMFSDEDRSLASTYTLTQDMVNTPPAALRNLAAMAELSLDLLWEKINNGDEGARETLIEKANQALHRKFMDAWKQSTLTAQLKIEGAVLAIRIKQDGVTITQFHERSAGLQMFVALVAFLAVKGTNVPPVLLIDEAETHLHIDAQADLVNTFMTQQQAAKIIYTTHSPACLPPDLGSNIRAVLPDKVNAQRSVIEGSFWRGAAGYSPLMLAMGAGAAAFSPARRVVLAEGAAEMLLLPSLIKFAIEADDLDYQVAPGLSEVPASMYPDLDLEAARVAFLVDGDKGGQDIQAALTAAGVPKSRVLGLGALTLENLLDPLAYREVVAKLINDANPTVTINIDDVPVLTDPDTTLWPNVLQRWADDHGYSLPGKRVIASRLVEEGLAKPSHEGAKVLRRLHKSLSEILKASLAAGS